jgi:hypothetical protein
LRTKKAAGRKTPREVKSEADLIAMRRANIEIGDYWMMLQEAGVFFEVVIANQKLGEAPTGKVHIPRHVFAAMVDWFNQGTVPRTPRRSTGRTASTQAVNAVAGTAG